MLPTRILDGGLYFKEGENNKARLTVMTIMFSWSHFKDKIYYITIETGSPSQKLSDRSNLEPNM